MSTREELVATRLTGNSELCRLCANTDKQLIPIFKGEGEEHNISDQIKKYLPIIKVTEMDKLPLQVCYQCTSTLIAWHNFFEQCRVADNRLRELLATCDKLNLDDESYHAFVDDFPNDFEDQPSADENFPVEVSTKTDSPLLETDDTTPLIIKSSNKSEVETLNEDRCCLRSPDDSISKEDLCANKLGTRIGIGVLDSTYEDVRETLAHGLILSSIGAKSCPYGICVCIWNNAHCSKCSLYNKFPCRYCSMIFVEAKERNFHVRKSHSNHLFRYCLNWLYENSLKSNNSSNYADDCISELPRFECNDCSVTLCSKRILIKHLKAHQSSTKLSLQKNHLQIREHDDTIVPSRSALAAHSKWHHDDVSCVENISCDSTNNKSGSCVTVMKRQIVSNEITDHYQCNICDQIFFKRHSFTRHLNLHASNSHNCDKCEINFVSGRLLAAHKARKHNQLPKNTFVLNGRRYLKCEQCSFTCRNERNKLEEHMRVHTGEKPFTCELCGKQFRTQSLLRVHLRFVHEGVKKHACDICGRSFSNRRYMEEHRRIHTGEKPLICDFCGRTFRQTSSLTKHIEHHLGIKKHACHLCPKRFSNTHHLDVHVKRHMGVATHVCTQCGKAFVDQYQLKNHHVVHSNARPFLCKRCGAGFKLRKHLKQHERTHRFLS